MTALVWIRKRTPLPAPARAAVRAAALAVAAGLLATAAAGYQSDSAMAPPDSAKVSPDSAKVPPESAKVPPAPASSAVPAADSAGRTDSAGRGAAGPEIRPLLTLRLDVDAARFLADDTLTLVEVYFGTSESMLGYRMPAGSPEGGLALHLDVSAAGRKVAERSWTLHHRPDTTATGPPMNVLSRLDLALPDGEYTLTLRARDLTDSTRADTVSMPLPIESFFGDRVMISDIQFATSITQGAAPESPFHKNTLDVIPNPGRLYGDAVPKLHFYYEVYNLERSGQGTGQGAGQGASQGAGQGGSARLAAMITDANGAVRASSTKPKPRTHNSTAEFGSFDLKDLASGTYTLRIELSDTSRPDSGVLARREKKFFVYPDEPARGGSSGAAPAGDPFAAMTDAEASAELERIVYVAREPERRQIDALQSEQAEQAEHAGQAGQAGQARQAGQTGKQNYLRNFWAGRDPDPATPVNELRDDYLIRVADADARFGERGIAGWKTDRGRVRITYGLPDEIERFPSEPSTRPHEIWHYQAIRGGVIFVFVDRTGFGSYRLVHSTHIDELRNDAWMQEEATVR